jgi:hypothetical protein
MLRTEIEEPLIDSVDAVPAGRVALEDLAVPAA